MAGKGVYALHGVKPGNAKALNSAVSAAAGGTAAKLVAAPAPTARPHVTLSGNLSERDSLSHLRDATASSSARGAMGQEIHAAILGLRTAQSVQEKTPWRIATDKKETKAQRRQSNNPEYAKASAVSAKAEEHVQGLLEKRRTLAAPRIEARKAREATADMEKAGQGDMFKGFHKAPVAIPVATPPRVPVRAEISKADRYSSRPDKVSVNFKGSTYTVEKRLGDYSGRPSMVITKDGRHVDTKNVPTNISRRGDTLLAAGQRRADSMPAMGRKPTGPVRMSYSKDAAGEHTAVNFRGAKYEMHRLHGAERDAFTKNGKPIDNFPKALDKSYSKRFDAVKSKAVGRMTNVAADAELKKAVGSTQHTPSSLKYMASDRGIAAIGHVRDARISKASATHQDALAARLKLNGDAAGARKATEAATKHRYDQKYALDKARAARAEASPYRQGLSKANAGLSAGAKARFAENDAAESKRFGSSKSERPALKPLPKAQALPAIPKAYVAPRMNPSTAKTKITGPGTVEEAHRGSLGGPAVRVTGETLASSNGFHLQGDRKGYRITDGQSGTVVQHLRVATKAEAVNAFKGMASGKTLTRAAAIGNGGQYNGRAHKALQRFGRIAEKRSENAAAARKAAPKPSKISGASATAA